MGQRRVELSTLKLSSALFTCSRTASRLQGAEVQVYGIVLTGQIFSCYGKVVYS